MALFVGVTATDVTDDVALVMAGALPATVLFTVKMPAEPKYTFDTLRLSVSMYPSTVPVGMYNHCEGSPFEPPVNFISPPAPNITNVSESGIPVSSKPGRSGHAGTIVEADRA